MQTGTVNPRAAHLSLALRHVADATDGISRAGIAARTGLNRSTASSLIDELITGGLVKETGFHKGAAKAGRPATALGLRDDGPAGLGIDVNVDYTAVCVVDLTGALRYKHVLAEDQRGHTTREILDRIARLARGAQQAADADGLTLCGSAVAVPGIVDRAHTKVTLAPNLGWRDLDVTEVLPADIHDGRTTLDNEANYAALSESALLRRHASYLFVSGQIGVGAGIVLDGTLYRGAHGWSGEIGHLTVDRDGPPCPCGRRGCLERYAGQEAILRAAGIGSDAGTSFGVRPTVAVLAERARAGCPATVKALTRAGHVLGDTLAGCLNLLDLTHVVLGGIYRELAPWMSPPIEHELSTQFLGAPWAIPTVQVATYGPEAPAIGAARSVIHDVLTNPLRWLTR
ncbi:ROK family transcriptional regulator [Actinoplanes derwentensis]|uniref:Sugar kinase of the NBD/HSP70 family, may contain an N-terminal HTH domain n=1 Tax=Actinoplanes derwentensis TaxID=113562 RepID=A0A1H1ZQM4_9ACTN|nr:ROK family transcriptional regulator [Actinoplanes derwentensis]GID89153.1 xylose repressor [Actinoplanes derwentensis]SDT35712.1 Sugar kinase of the NBD/HSP70 family, may contain an N-terminal HTH domain [Actinoplanes derwentensis]